MYVLHSLTINFFSAYQCCHVSVCMPALICCRIQCTDYVSLSCFWVQKFGNSQKHIIKIKIGPSNQIFLRQNFRDSNLVMKSRKSDENEALHTWKSALIIPLATGPTTNTMQHYLIVLHLFPARQRRTCSFNCPRFVHWRKWKNSNFVFYLNNLLSARTTAPHVGTIKFARKMNFCSRNHPTFPR